MKTVLVEALQEDSTEEEQQLPPGAVEEVGTFRAGTEAGQAGTEAGQVGTEAGQVGTEAGQVGTEAGQAGTEVGRAGTEVGRVAGQTGHNEAKFPVKQSQQTFKQTNKQKKNPILFTGIGSVCACKTVLIHHSHQSAHWLTVSIGLSLKPGSVAAGAAKLLPVQKAFMQQ